MQEYAGVSRRKCLIALQAKTILVNGVCVDQLKYPLSPGDVVTVDTVQYQVPATSQSKRVIAFHKPVAYVCSKDSTQGSSIYALLPDRMQSYQYIGRLDKDSRGLILFTNDYPLVHQLSHPRFGIRKKYIVTIDKPFCDADVKRCLQGVHDADDLLRALVIQYHGRELTITLGEGKNRHIRRMLAALGYMVVDLCRVQDGDVSLWDLWVGQRKDVTSLLGSHA